MSQATSSSTQKQAVQGRGDRLSTREKERSVRLSNIIGARAVADAVRTSLGPRGMDKMIVDERNDMVITNDGATILKEMRVENPAAKMLVELSHAQDVTAGDGTTSVVVIAGSLLNQCLLLLEKGIHPSTIADAFLLANKKAQELLEKIAIPVDITDRQSLINSATTSLSSKVVSQYSSLLAPMAVDAVLKLSDGGKNRVDLKDVRITKKLGGTVDDTEFVDGLVLFDRPNEASAKRVAGPKSVKDCKIGLIQFQLSSPKTNMDNSIVVHDFTQMDRILREERAYILKMCKKIQASGCNVLLVQKSIIRDAINDYSLHFLAKMKILVVTNIERDEIEFISKTLGCTPVANIDQFTPDKLGSAKLAEEVITGSGKIVKITGVPNPGHTVSVLVRGSNKLMIDEADRSLHDALCVIRSLVNKKFMVAGGASPEVEVALELEKFAESLQGKQQYCVKAFAEALDVIPITLAENAGLHPISILTELRAKHAAGQKYAGVNVRRGVISDMLEEKVVQPLLVTSSALQLATETVRMILKIDDLIMVR